MLDNDILSLHNEHLDEMPPPYTEFDETQLLFENTLPTLYPTDIVMATDGELTTAQQLVRPGDHGISIQLEAIHQTIVHIYPDNENRYQGLISVQAKFYHHHHRQLSDDDPIYNHAPSINCETSLNEKVSILQHIFRPSTISENVCCSFKVILPSPSSSDVVTTTGIFLPELLLRLPSNTQLVVQNIKQGVLGRLDAAVIQGVIEMQSVVVDNLRLATGDGSIDAIDVAVQTAAKFVAISGGVHLRQCTADKSIVIKTPEAKTSICSVISQRIDLYAGTKPINADNVQAETIHATSNSGHISMDCAAKELVIKTNSGPIRGAWNVSQLMDITAVSAIVRGSVEFSGDAARAKIRACGWPVSLAVNKEYLGHYNIRTVNSVVNFGLPRGTRYENHSHWCQGVIGIAANVLDVENANAPIVITAT